MTENEKAMTAGVLIKKNMTRKNISMAEAHGVSIEQNHIMVNDPSMTAWGWVVLTYSGVIVDAGAIKTEPNSKKLRIRKGDDRMRRICEINQQLINTVKKYNVNLLLSELPHGSQSAVAALMIGVVGGILQTISDCFDISIEWFSEADAKKSVSGKRSVGKDEMVDLIKTLYDVPWKKTKWENQAIADALAVYHVAKQQSSILKMYSHGKE